jgi:hypothetical protein
MLDLLLSLSVSVHVRSILHTQPLGSYNKILVGNLFVHRYFSPLLPFLLISPILQMVNAENNNAENNNTANPPLTLEQVLMMQAQMLQTIQQTMVNMQNARPQAPLPPPRDRLGDFQRTKPLTFSHSVEPMDADNWLKTVERKLQVVQYNNREKVLLASHQLIGPTVDWWDAYVETHEEPDTINWNELKMAFRSHHIPQVIIKLKKEFQDLKQGSMTLSEYVTHFTQVSHCAPNDVDTDEKKQECFLNRLDDGLAYPLEA